MIFMKRLILTVFVLLLHISSWAQSNSKLAGCYMQIKHTVTAPSCFNGMDGRIVLQINSAKKPYTVQWSDEGQGKNRSALAAGTYAVTVRDAAGCVKKIELSVPQGRDLQGSLIVKQQTSAAGKIRLAVSFADGDKPFAISIKNLSEGRGAPWQSYNGQELAEAMYMIEAFTQAGCSQIEKIDLRN